MNRKIMCIVLSYQGGRMKAAMVSFNVLICDSHFTLQLIEE